MLAGLALVPVVALLALMFLARRPLWQAAPLCWGLTLAVGLAGWTLPAPAAAAASFRGLLIAVDIGIIIFGAVFFLEFLKQTGAIRSIQASLARLSSDLRVQGVIVAWLFGSFLEGVAGFGTPAAVVAPLLAGIGFPVATAVTISLLANSTAVTFGAIGTPMRVGFADHDLAPIALQAATVNLVAGVLIPVLIVLAVVSAPRNAARGGWLRGLTRREFVECVPFALFAGFALTAPSLAASYFGHEFPSILGGLTGLAIVVPLVKKGWLVPRTPWLAAEPARKEADTIARDSLLRSFGPYLVLCALLVAGKFVFSDLDRTLLLGSGITHRFSSFNPGFAFLTAGAVLVMGRGTLRSAADAVLLPMQRAARSLAKPMLAIAFISAMVQLFVHSARNTAGHPGMLEVIAAQVEGMNLPFFMPFVGAFGSFFAGSATVSNLLFGSLGVQMAAVQGVAVSSVLALQAVGAAAGNMIALPNIVAVQATVGDKQGEAQALKPLVLPCLIYLVACGLAGLVLLE